MAYTEFITAPPPTARASKKSNPHRNLHRWMRRQIAEPASCPACLRSVSLDLANVSGTYSQDLGDWTWLCRSCHIKSHLADPQWKEKRGRAADAEGALGGCSCGASDAEHTVGANYSGLPGY